MPDKDDLVLQYLKQINEASDKQGAIQDVISKINGLVYSESKLPISNEDKLYLFKKLVDSLPSYQNFSYKQERFDESIESSHRIRKATDNSEMLSMMAKLEAKMKGNKK